MSQKQAGSIAAAQTLNPRASASEQVRRFIDRRTNMHRRDCENQRALNNAAQLTEEERHVRSHARTTLMDRLGVQADVERLIELSRSRRDRVKRALSTIPALGVLDIPGVPFSPSDGVDVWWAMTSWYYPSAEATVYMDDDGVHLAASFESDDGDLHTFSIRVVAHFGIGMDRLPALGRSYLSNPVFDVSGPAYGFAMHSGLYDFGDTWSKCWLTMKQTVFAFPISEPSPPPPPGVLQVIAVVGQPVGVASDSRTVIFTETGDATHVNLPGLMSLPATFFLPEGTASLLFELEWRFDIQIEDGFLYLGHRPEAPVCNVRHPQWRIRAL